MRPLWKPQPHRRPVFKNVPIFEYLPIRNLTVCSRQTAENRDIFGSRAMMRRVGYIGEGAFSKRLPYAAFFGYFLGGQESNTTALS